MNLKHLKIWAWAAPVLVVGGAIALKTLALRGTKAPTRESSADGIGCMGRIEPEGGVMTLAAPALDGQPPILKELKFKEGQCAKAGEVLAVLASSSMLKSAYDRSLSQRSLAQSEYESAASSYRRKEALSKAGDISEAAFEGAQSALDGAKYKLEVATSDVKYAWEKWQASLIKAPADGCILAIHANPGEGVGGQGVLEFGGRNQEVIAEVHESDVSSVREGDPAEISGEVLGPSRTVKGRVYHVGSLVTKNAVLPNDPSQFSDERVVKVRIKVLDPNDVKTLAGLTYSKVSVRILRGYE